MPLQAPNGAMVLIVEDNRVIAEMLGDFLQQRGWQVDFAGDGVSGLHLASTKTFDVIVLDLMLPGIDGLTLCRRLRKEGRVATPVLMLTARDSLDDKVAGFEAGADDYLIKPFEARELEARLHALVRRARKDVANATLTIGDLTYDPATCRVTRAGLDLDVSPLGQRLLAILMRASPHLVRKRDIEREIWGDEVPDSDTLRSHLYNLRSVVDKPFARPLIHTISNQGIRLSVDGGDSHPVAPGQRAKVGS